METALLINILIYFLGARTKLKEQQKLYQYAEFQSIVISVTIFPLTNPTISLVSPPFVSFSLVLSPPISSHLLTACLILYHLASSPVFSTTLISLSLVSSHILPTPLVSSHFVLFHLPLLFSHLLSLSPLLSSLTKSPTADILI